MLLNLGIGLLGIGLLSLVLIVMFRSRGFPYALLLSCSGWLLVCFFLMKKVAKKSVKRKTKKVALSSSPLSKPKKVRKQKEQSKDSVKDSVIVEESEETPLASFSMEDS